MITPTPLLLFLTAASLTATEVAVDFQIPTGLNRILGSASFTFQRANPGFGQTDTFTANFIYSGNILANLDIDTVNNTLNSVEFTGGTISTSNLTGNLDITIGITPYDIIFQKTNVTRSLTSSSPDPLTNGVLNSTLHSTTFSSGTIIVTNSKGTSPFESETQSTNLNQHDGSLVSNQFFFDSPSGATGPTISLTPGTEDTWGKSYLATLNAILQTPQNSLPFPIQAAGFPEGNFFQQYYSEECFFFRAEASFTVPTPFGAWSSENNLTNPDPTNQNSAGIPYALLFALDLPIQTSALPITFINNSPPTIQIPLPQNGLPVTITIEHSEDLVQWDPLPTENFLNGSDSLNQGATGTPSFTFPGSTRSFISLSVTL
ncbi:MAG: hypothetical protein AAGC74_13270 [Verrucomicrobiota bacterium]